MNYQFNLKQVVLLLIAVGFTVGTAFGEEVFSTTNIRSNTNENVNADNSGVNVRDRDESQLTPLDQSNDPGDLSTTQNIRQGLMQHAGLSLNAKNIKVITVNGQVTLRGPVESVEEKSTAENIAVGIAGAGKVSNQLEVKS